MIETPSAPTERPRVTAIMPALNAAESIETASRSVLAQEYSGHLDLVIAHGPSTDATSSVLAELESDPRVTVVTNPSGGTAAGLNAAIAAASGSVLARVDAHCQVPPLYISRAVATLERTGAANVGGIQRAVGTEPLQRAVAAAMSSRFGVGDAKFHYGGAEGPTDTVYLGVFRADAVHAVGCFDQSLVRNQDYDLNIRLRDAGYTVWFDPQLVVDYSPRDSLDRLGRQYFDYGRWKREVVRRRPGSTRLRQLIAPVTVSGLAAAIALALSGHRWAWSAPLTYVAAVTAASATTEGVASSDRKFLPLVFPTMHLSWGLGFLVGPPRNAMGCGARTPKGLQ